MYSGRLESASTVMIVCPACAGAFLGLTAVLDRFFIMASHSTPLVDKNAKKPGALSDYYINPDIYINH
jgi:hypothetical protein